MSMNVENAIQEKVRNLPEELQNEVLEFVENLQNVHPAESSGIGNNGRKAVDLREHGMSREQAADLRASLATFEDWNDPEMDIYDDYDQALATLNQKS